MRKVNRKKRSEEEKDAEKRNGKRIGEWKKTLKKRRKIEMQ